MVDADVVVDKLRHINQYTNDLKQMRGMSMEEYVEDMVTQRAVERTFMNLIQSVSTSPSTFVRRRTSLRAVRRKRRWKPSGTPTSYRATRRR